MEASCPIPTKKGEEIIIRAGRFYMVTNKIQGDFLPPQERYGENRDKIAVKYGSAIGKLHEALLEVEDLVEVNDTNMLDMVMNWAMPHTKTMHYKIVRCLFGCGKIKKDVFNKNYS